MKTSEVLNRAADLIEERGWTTGNSGFSGPRICLEGGLIAALGMGPRFVDVNLSALWACPAYRSVALYLDRDLTIDRESLLPKEPLWRWNDVEGRTATEVIEALRACAVIESAREEARLPGGVRPLPGHSVPVPAEAEAAS